MSTLHACFASAARTYFHRPFLYERGEGSRGVWTYGDVWTEVERMAGFLQKNDVRRGQVVALLAENRREWLVAYLAAVSRGAMVMPLDPLQSVNEWRKALKHAQVRGLFGSE